MSLKTDFELVAAEEGMAVIYAIASNSLEHCLNDILAALFRDDEAEAGRILNKFLSEDFKEQADALQDAEANWREEAREIDKLERLLDMKGAA